MEPEPSKGWRLYTEIFPEEYCVLCCTTESGKFKHRRMQRKLSSNQLLSKYAGMTSVQNDN